MIEFAKVKRPKKFGVGHSTTENTEDTEKENNLAGGFSPRPPSSQKTKKPRGSRGEAPSPAAFLSVPSVFSVVKNPYSEILLSVIQGLCGRSNYYTKIAYFEPCRKNH